MVIYFSGTGNSRYCAEMIAHRTNDDIVNSHNYIKDMIAPGFISSSAWVFVCPTYAWQMPRVFKKFIRSGGFSGSKDAYFVLTCGSETGNAQKGIKKLCDDMGFNYKGMLCVCMPENYIAMFPVPSEERCAKMISAAEKTLEAGIAKILKGENFEETKVSAMDRFKSGPINKGFYLACMNTKHFYSTDKCISCEKCAKVCALNNITYFKGRPVWGKNCTQCMACICLCPEEAIEYGKRSVGKRRYECPEYVK